MPLLCISLLVLLLLPVSLSCDISRLEKIRSEYNSLIKMELQRTTEEIATLVQNSNCTAFGNQPRSCMSDNESSVNILFKLICKMKNLLVSHPNERINSLTASVLNSMLCSCPEKPTKKPKAYSKRRRATTRRRRDDRTKKGRETKKLCKANAILSVVTECYEMLNSLNMDT